jgi:hypothetical protein
LRDNLVHTVAAEAGYDVKVSVADVRLEILYEFRKKIFEKICLVHARNQEEKAFGKPWTDVL